MATPAIKSAVAGKNAEELVASMRSVAHRAALLFDIDGTLAPIVPRPEEASVPVSTGELLIELQTRYALVACVSGRRAEDARAVVGIDSLDYIGNHGLERLRPGATRVEQAPGLDEHRDRMRAFANDAYTAEVRGAGVRLEDKDVIWSFHWREARHEPAARAALERVAVDARAEGLATHWGRKVLEIRPPVQFDKGTALESLLEGAKLAAALYAGDDATDLDAFRKLRELRTRGGLEYALCVGVRSGESPAQITSDADLTVEGPSGVAELLAALR